MADVITATRTASWDTLSSLQASFTEVANQIISFIPDLIWAIVVLIVGWFVIRLVQGITSRVLSFIGIDRIAKKLNIDQGLRSINIQIPLSQVISKVVYYLALVVVFKMTVSVLNLWEVTDALDSVLEFVTTNVLSASIIIAVGIYVAAAARRIIKNVWKTAKLRQADLLSKIAYVAIIVFTVIPGLERLGVDISILQDNITILFAGLALAIGLGGKKTLEAIFDDLYSKFKN